MGALVVRFSIEGEESEDELEDEALRRAFHLWVALIFEESHMRCPMRTGRLINSSRVEGEEDWREIIYDCEYAEEVEDGRGQPGEKYFFEGRHFVDGAIEDNIDRFEVLYKLALAQFFKVDETL